jgi:hypothetical protein
MGLKSMDKMEIDLSLSQEIGATFLEACNTWIVLLIFSLDQFTIY